MQSIQIYLNLFTSIETFLTFADPTIQYISISIHYKKSRKNLHNCAKPYQTSQSLLEYRLASYVTKTFQYVSKHNNEIIFLHFKVYCSKKDLNKLNNCHLHFSRFKFDDFLHQKCCSFRHSVSY